MIALDLSGSTAVVTGGGRGIGRASAIALAEAGADVTVTARTVSELEETAAEVEKRGRRALVVPGDATDPATAEKVAAAAEEKFGRVSILFNNAGMELPKPLLDCTPDEFQLVMDVNVKSMMLFTQAVGKRMIAAGGGRIINMASTGSFIAGPNQALYHAAKAACAHFTRAVAIEWARHKVYINAVAPGWVNTDLISHLTGDPEKLKKYIAGIPMRRLGEPEEIARVVVFLASQLAGYMTGSIVVVDGGMMIP